MTTFEAAVTKPIRVVFLTFYIEAWDALADVHAQMLEDSRFEVTVASIPRRFSKDQPFAEEDKVSEFFDDLGVKHIRLNDEDSFKGLERIRKLAPDYVFINYPWQRNYQPGYRVEALSEFTKVCYVPYYALALANEPDITGVAPYLYSQRSNQLASLLFAMDPNILAAYATTERGNNHVHLTGTPKIDALIRKAAEHHDRWPLKNAGNQRMIWAPHHSFSASWLNFGNFTTMYQEILKFAKQNPALDIVMRPHPFMFSTLVDRAIIEQDVLNRWLAEWNALPNTAIDHEGDIAHLFSAADLLLTDGISFIGEYPLATGKPAIFLEKPGHWPFSPIGELAAATTIRVQSFDQFEKAFEAFTKDGLPDRSREIAALRSAAQPYPGQAAAKILEVVLADHAAKTPLVDRSLITETPWESRPEAEPAWD